MSVPSREILDGLFHHVVLPARLPGKPEPNLVDIEQVLAQRLYQACCQLRDCPAHPSREIWDRVCRTFAYCGPMHSSGGLNKTSLLDAFSRLQPRDFLVLHIASQNAGLLVWHYGDNSVVFEPFEACARATDTLASNSVLIRDFPGSGVEVPQSTFGNTQFQCVLASFLEQASLEDVKDFAPISNKARAGAYEIRDSVDPSIITQMLMSILEANGRRISPVVLRKRVRDDVIWTDGAERPWRRSSFYLVLRVALQRYCCDLLGPEAGRISYKFVLSLFLTNICNDCRLVNSISPENLALVRRKLSKRIVKLQFDISRGLESSQYRFQELLKHTLPIIENALDAANDKIFRQWQVERQKSIKAIPLLPSHSDRRSFFLRLNNSGQHLLERLQEGLLQYHSSAQPIVPAKPAGGPQLHRNMHLPRNLDSELYHKIANMEKEMAHELAQSYGVTASERCIRLADWIVSYQRQASGPYDCHSEQKSSMLLNIMELWVEMDKCAIALLPLLKDYDPGFAPDILHCLYVRSFNDMRRLHNVELHLIRRSHRFRGAVPSLYADITQGCFGERYFEESADSATLKSTMDEINLSARQDRERKEQERQQLSDEYEDLMRKFAESACIYTTDELEPLIRRHDDRRCQRCYFRRCAKRLRIQVHEDPLPEDPVSAKAIISEFWYPEYFCAYRYATWTILRDLSRPQQIQDRNVQILVHEYSGLKPHARASKFPVGLGSRTKSFLSSHYASIRFPVDAEKVCHPNGLKVALFDSERSLWMARQTQKTSFASHCPLNIPQRSPFSVLQFDSDYPLAGPGRTPNQIVSSQTKCPSDINIHEFMAFQDLHSGQNMLWVKLLREMASSNLNFSTVAVASMVSRLALQAGEPLQRSFLRAKHWVLGENSFAEAFFSQIRVRLDAISTNWRETSCMESLVTLVLRIWCLASSDYINEKVHHLMAQIRKILLNWISSLRGEIFDAPNADISQQRSRDALWASLICRKTFIQEAQQEGDLLPAEAFEILIETSIVLRDNCPTKISQLPTHIRNALISDFGLVSQLSNKLRHSILRYPCRLERAINKIWPESPGDLARQFCQWQFLERPKESWIWSQTKPSQTSTSQEALYNYIDGFLLVNGQPVGQLPEHIKNSELIKFVLGDKNLSTYRSHLKGMIYVISRPIEGHEIHIGIRQEKPFIRARNKRGIMELIPHDVFRRGAGFDIPTPLIFDHVHWLDFPTGIVSIRKRSFMWKIKQSEWRINVNERHAKRRSAFLLDPTSSEYQRIGQIFDFFVPRDRLIVYQPPRNNLTVELPTMELSFTVDKFGALHCRALRAYIEPNQDIGTWYGLSSKLVLKDPSRQGQRSVIIPLGDVRAKRYVTHVRVMITPSSDYGKFTVNEVLGRLDCPAEPRLQFVKALLHAYTSYTLPDPLLGQTGTEEALQNLQSSSLQPWCPLSPATFKVLSSIASLTPRREYYPSDMKVMQKCTWSPDLTNTIQSSEYRSVIETIFKQSASLAMFSSSNQACGTLDRCGSAHLQQRTRFCNPDCSTHASSRSILQGANGSVANHYQSRDRLEVGPRRHNVYESAILFRLRPQKLPVPQDLLGILQNWPNIGGYTHQYNKVSLDELLHVDFALEWGPLSNLCSSTQIDEDCFRPMFFFSIISFGLDINMDVVRTLIALTMYDELKRIKPPGAALFAQFRAGQKPSPHSMRMLLEPYRLPYTGDTPNDKRDVSSFHYLQRQKQVEKEYADQSVEDCKSLAEFLCNQWPNQEITLEGFSRPVLVNVTQALEVIIPEWQRLCENLELSNHLAKIQTGLSAHCSQETHKPDCLIYQQTVLLPTERANAEFAPLRELMALTGPARSEKWQSLLISECSYVGTCGLKLTQKILAKIFTWRQSASTQLRIRFRPSISAAQLCSLGTENFKKSLNN